MTWWERIGVLYVYVSSAPCAASPGNNDRRLRAKDSP
jgi:hypothetical protein